MSRQDRGAAHRPWGSDGARADCRRAGTFDTIRKIVHSDRRVLATGPTVRQRGGCIEEQDRPGHKYKSQTVVVRKAALAIRRDVPHAKRRRSWPQWKFVRVGVGKSARCRLVARCQIARGLTRISTLTWPTLRGRPGPLLTRAPWRKRPPKLHVAADWSCSKRNGLFSAVAPPNLRLIVQDHIQQ